MSVLFQLIPNSYEFDDLESVPAYVSIDGSDFRIQQGTSLRVKLTGVRTNADAIVCL